MKRFLLACLVCLTIAAVPSCDLKYFESTEFGDIVFDPSLAIPVGTITYTVAELFEELNDGGAVIAPNGEDVVTLTYTETLQSQSASGFLTVLDQSFGSSLVSGTDLSNPPVETTISISELYEFDLTQTADEDYDSIIFNAGSFDFNASSNIGADVDFTATFISLENATGPIVITGSLPSGGANFVQSESLVNGKGLFHLDDQGNPASSKFLVRIAYNITVGPTNSITADQQVSFTIGINNTSFQTVYGNVGNQSLTVGQQDISLDFFSTFDSGDITFADPTVRFIFDNSFGFPLGIDFQQITAVSGTGTNIPLQGTVVDNLQVVNAPSVSQQGQVVRTEIEVTANNSNIDALLSSKPTRFLVDVGAESNPATAPASYNFIDDSNLLDVSVEIEIPLELNINGLIAEEVVDFSNGDDLAEAKRLLFRVIAENELPLGGLVELQFRDGSGAVIYTVDERPAFTAAAVGVDGRTNEVAMSTVDILIPEEGIRIIENAASINVVATLTTTDAQNATAVKFFNDYELRFKLAVQADVEVNSNGN
ncbi:hypothetical protein [Roseivirga sp. E12]|uniref:hypothetical protein n=1 Tax=Roseivirga sp. E12 TaxID=2819237 RepID=UPI001ABD28D5|nr:hypothetical protein [Roseivirga sp. E12]MBO3698429.1 hypothetical protein [Roseivirga sp. E12]